MRRRQLREEVANAITHGAGLLLAVGAVPVLVTLGVLFGSARHVTGFLIYGLTLVVLYAASTLYHAIPLPKAKQRLRVFDHAAIYLLIAGTYTPVALIALEGLWGWGLLAAVWTMALCGVAFKLLFTGRFEGVSVAMYLGMGWLAVVAIGPIVEALPMAGLAWLVAGGVSYSAGVFFYRWKQLPYGHAVWHLFVLGGSVCHFVAIAGYVW